MNQDTGKKQLRYAILCDDFIFPKWKEDCLTELMNLSGVQLVLIIRNKKNNSALNSESGFKTKSHFLYRICTRFFFKFSTDKRKDISALLKDIPVLECAPTLKGRYSQYFSDEDLRTIAQYKCDFILRLGFNILRGKILDVAKYGVWSFHGSDEMKYRGGPAAFWEIFNNDPVNATILQRLTDRLDGGIVLKKYFFKTVNHSYTETTDTILSWCKLMPKQVCIDILNNNADYFNNSPSSTNAKINTYPSDFEMILFLFKLFINKIRYHYHHFFRVDDWNIGIIEQPIHHFLTPQIMNSVRIHWLYPSSSVTHAADPFGYSIDGKRYVIFEEINFHNEKGKISTALTEQQRFQEITTTFQLPTHLSYPYIIEHDNEIYCLPENHEANKLNIYQLNKTINNWHFSANILNDIAAIDSTLIHHEGKWWLFFTDKNKITNAQLFIYYAEDLFGPYRPHDNNPVKVNIFSARCAGNIIEHNGFLYRPSQDCSITSGGKIYINKIKVLTSQRFEEETVNIIEPFRDEIYSKGIHTLSRLGNYTLIDSKRYVFSFSNFIYRLKNKFR